MALAIALSTCFPPSSAEAAVAVELPNVQKKFADGSLALSPSSSEPASAPLSSATAKKVDVKTILQKSAKRAVGGGLSGSAASVLQVFSLMWLRTSMNYQYTTGLPLNTTLATLWSEGGVPRFYRGLPFALVQAPLSKFGDTAANAGVLALLDSFESTMGLPLFVKTASASVAAGLWRIVIFPVDTFKTTMQVRGAAGIPQVSDKVKETGPTVLYNGAIAASAATFVGHYPWFFTYNYLQEHLPPVEPGDTLMKLMRNAFIGLCASSLADSLSNSLRVIKTTKQTSEDSPSYREVVSGIIEKDGVRGLFGRGLATRLLTNGVQGMLFAVAYRFFEEQFFKK
ncbi:unnamed protein product [Vitrella brassicaformis CCMP3155]|uniref:Mitochondrial carrier protein n=1 Tax=Vitrella brassicaformis (strain CCMP3155) TaxID=1169540 RepID=A0A0G4GYY9_VITBC|nr:unnamed protein product [Vitrella brassicaformis CCMP3155]|eukprot:CEM36155.1 unnamed protein product [Vitrella brassicaformis CCMP3155]